jgi:Domain of unknown function (DUF4180)
MIKYRKIEEVIIAELIDDSLIISHVQDALDMIGECGMKNCNRITIREHNLNPDFFRLHTGLAGDILQKFSTYDFKLAIVGDFSKFKSKNLQDFIRESNKGNRIYFVENLASAFNKLTGKSCTK